MTMNIVIPFEQGNNFCQVVVTGLSCQISGKTNVSDFWQSLFKSEINGSALEQKLDESGTLFNRLSKEALVDDGFDLNTNDRISIVVFCADKSLQDIISANNIGQTLGIKHSRQNIDLQTNSFSALNAAIRQFQSPDVDIVLLVLANQLSGAAFVLRRREKIIAKNKRGYASLFFSSEGKDSDYSSQLPVLYKELGLKAQSIDLLSVVTDDLPEPQLKTLSPLFEECCLNIATDEILILVKTVLCLQQRILLPNTEQFDTAGLPFYINETVRPWFCPQVHPLFVEMNKEGIYLPHLRKAAIHYADHYGNLAHLILEEYEDIGEAKQSELRPEWQSEIFTFSANDKYELLNYLGSIRSYLNMADSVSLKDLAFTINSRTAEQINNQSNISTYRAAFVCSNIEEFLDKLQQLINHCLDDGLVNGNSFIGKGEGDIYWNNSSSFASSAIRGGQVAFVLPGLGAAYPNMLLELCLHFPEVRAIFDFVDYLAVNAGAEVKPSDRIFSRLNSSVGTFKETPATLAMMDSAVIIVLLAEWAIFTLLLNLGIVPDVLLGCSTGEFAALTMSGAIDIMKSAPIFYHLSTGMARALPIEQLINLRSLKVNTAWENVEEQLKQYENKIFLSADLSLKQLILTGDKQSINSLAKSFDNSGISFDYLPFAIPYHTSLVSNVVSDNDPDIQKLKIVKPMIESWSCSLSQAYPSQPEQIRKMTTDLFSKPILFRKSIETLYNKGIRTFIEVGPRGNLAPVISETLEDRPHLSLAANRADVSAITQLNHLLSALFVNFVQLDLSYLYTRRNGKQLSVTTAEPQEFSIDSFRAELARLEAQMLSFLNGDNTPTINIDDSQRSPQLAFLKDVQVKQNNGCLEAELDIYPESYLFLIDHAIGENVRTVDGKVERVYLMPLTVIMEIMAEAAKLIHPRMEVIEVSNLRAFKRIRVGKEGYKLGIKANEVNSSFSSRLVKVVVYNAASSGEAVMECEITLAEEYEEPSGRLFSIATDTNLHSHLFNGQLYGRGRMFHGPKMQSVLSLGQVKEKQIVGKVSTRTPQDWFKQNLDNQHSSGTVGTKEATGKNIFLINPLLLDNATQLVLFYLFAENEPVDALLPFMLDSLKVYRPFVQLPNEVQVAVNLRSVTTRGTEADITIQTESGDLIAEFRSLCSRRIILSEQWRDYIYNASNVYLSEDILLAEYFDHPVIGDQTNMVCRCITIDNLPADDGVLSWCADYVLTPAEMEEFESFTQLRKRKEWLAGRIAVKESVRLLIDKLSGVSLANADIQIASLPSGQPYIKEISGIKNLTTEAYPVISISHKNNCAVGIAANKSIFSAIGIDLESTVLPDDIEDLILKVDEQKCIQQISENKKIILGKIWSAKEAVAKLLGLGLPDCLANLSIADIDSKKTELIIQTKNIDTYGGQNLRAYSGMFKDMILTVAFIQS